MDKVEEEGKDYERQGISKGFQTAADRLPFTRLVD